VKKSTLKFKKNATVYIGYLRYLDSRTNFRISATLIKFRCHSHHETRAGPFMIVTVQFTLLWTKEQRGKLAWSRKLDGKGRVQYLSSFVL
jgi:hypothetical protein